MKAARTVPGTYYDPEVAPAAQEWLAMSEQERSRLVGNFHQTAKIQGAGVGHALIHTVVENYLAQRFGPACNALKMLTDNGLSRHEAIHQLGDALMKSYAASETDPGAQQQVFAIALKAIALPSAPPAVNPKH